MQSILQNHFVLILKNRNCAVTLEVYPTPGETHRRALRLSLALVLRFSTTATTATGEVVVSHVKVVHGYRPSNQHAVVSILLEGRHV